MDVSLLIFKLIDMLALPLLICSSMRAMLKLTKPTVPEGLRFYGWCLCLENLTARLAAHVLGTVLHREIGPGQLAYTLCVMVCSALIGYAAVMVTKHVSVKVDESDAEKE